MPGRAWCLCGFVLCLLSALAVAAAEPAIAADPCREVPGEVCPADSRQVVRLTTDLGVLELELQPDAAPRAVAFVVRLARGPVFNPALVDSAAPPPRTTARASTTACVSSSPARMS